MSKQSQVPALTIKVIDRVRPGKVQFETRCPGFGVRAYATRKVFIVATTVATPTGRSTKWKTLGDATGPNALVIDDARKLAQAQLGVLKKTAPEQHGMTLRRAIAGYCADTT